MYSMFQQSVLIHPGKPSPPAGRPRAFLPEHALQSALDVFWRQGFEATSLDDLTGAMGLSRSSFYGCFGSKRAVFMAALRAYAEEHFEAISRIASSATQPVAAVLAILTTITSLANSDDGRRGCFFVNSVTELAPHDPALADYSRSHIVRVLRVVSDLLILAGFKPRDARERAGAALALAMGTLTLRKAGMPAAPVKALLKQMHTLLALP